MNPTFKKKKKKIKPNGRIGRNPYDPTILCDLTRSYIQFYNFCDFATILNFLVRWDRKIARFYNLNRDFDKHGWHHQVIDICKLRLKAWRHEHIEEWLKLESLIREEEVETLELETWKLEVYQKKNFKAWTERVYLDFRDLKSEELNLKCVLGRREKKRKKKQTFNKILEDLENIKITDWLAFWVLGFHAQVSNFFNNSLLPNVIIITISYLMLSSLVSWSFLSLYLFIIIYIKLISSLG